MVEEFLKRCFKVSVSQRVSGKWFVEAIATINIFNSEVSIWKFFNQLIQNSRRIKGLYGVSPSERTLSTCSRTLGDKNPSS